jgi:hypothetical protein
MEYVSGYGRIYVGSADGIQFLSNGGSDLLATAYANGNWSLTGYLSAGPGSPIGGATNPLTQLNGSSNNYVQAYVHNDSSGVSASADLVVYPNNGVDTNGWADLGITSSGYADTYYTVTGPNESYLFGSAPSGSGTSGNFVFATDSTGTSNAFQWYVGGFNQTKSAYKMQLSATNLYVKQAIKADGVVESTTGGFKFPDGTTQTTASSGGGSPSGATGSVQYNNAGAFAGAANVDIDNGDLLLTYNASPVIPPTSTVKLFGKQIAGRNLPAFISPSGLDSSLQPFMGRNKVAYISFTVGATTATGIGLALTATGTATAATFATTNLANSINRLDYRATTAATTAVSGFRGGAQSYWLGTGTGLGGFTYVCRWGIGGLGTALTTMRAFVGLRASTAAPTDVAPNTLTNAIGMGWDSTDTTVQIYACGTANSKINTGITLNRALSSQVFEISMFAAPNTNKVTFTVLELGTTNTFTTTVDGATAPTNLPITTTAATALNPYGYTSAGGTSTSMSIAIASIYVETDY